MYTIALFVGIVFIATFAQGITGFGWSVIAGPIILIFLDKETYIISSLVISFVLNGMLLYKIKSPPDRHNLKTLIFASVLGIPVGIFILKIIPIFLLKIVIGFLSTGFALLMLKKKDIVIGEKLGAPIGLLTGILNSSVNMSGPLLALYYTSRKLNRDVMRKSLVTIFFVLSFIALPILLVTVNFNMTKVFPGIIAAPFTLIGGYLGDRLATHIPTGTFRKYVLWFVIAIGVYITLSGIIYG